jgi:phosphopantothenoylcysteine decarboxylase / phosphopantothenate---cysteine ligase
MRILVTAGPTREAIDPVRFLSNRSSGRMGYAIAQALRDCGHEVVLVSGPVQLAAPEGVELHSVESAREMLAASLDVWSDCDALFAVAAVADFRPKQCSAEKLKRGQGQGTVLELVPNPDIVATLAQQKRRRLVVGFALESHHGRAEALRKMKDKFLDFVALNGPQAQGATRSKLLLLSADGSEQVIGPACKGQVARELVQGVLEPNAPTA